MTIAVLFETQFSRSYLNSARWEGGVIYLLVIVLVWRLHYWNYSVFQLAAISFQSVLHSDEDRLLRRKCKEHRDVLQLFTCGSVLPNSKLVKRTIKDMISQVPGDTDRTLSSPRPSDVCELILRGEARGII